MLARGTILASRYRIKHMIGKGGSGCVYLAEDLNIGQNWAVKQLYFSNRLNRKLADHEVDMMKQLDYYMFPRIVDAWQEKDSYYIVSDYVEGISLASLLKDKRIPKSTALRWSIDLAKALYYLHSRDPVILYLDLKPENIMVKPDGSICLIDFGIAKSIVEDLPPLGTKGYAAPEQYSISGQRQEEICPATDIYAFGMTMYEIYTSLSVSLDHNIQYKRVLKDYSIPKPIRRIILKCINSNPKRRYTHAGELLSALNHIGDKIHERKYKFIIILAVILMIPSGIATYISYENALIIEQNGSRLIEETSNMMIDGEYSREAVKLICTYLEADCLSEKMKTRFIYEVAQNYFLIQHNYKEALKYYNQLDQVQYPEVSYCIELCKLQTGFADNYEKREGCLQNFMKYNDGLSASISKYENYLLIATCYEQESELDRDSYKKAYVCLEKGLEDIELVLKKSDTGYEGLNIQELLEIKKEYERRLLQNKYFEEK